MNQSDADRQIEQMIAFIAQEAREKAEEISVKTEKEFMAEKLTLETQSSLAIRADHEKMKKDYFIQKAIEKSKLLSESRFTVMRKRDDKVNELKHSILDSLSETSKDPHYNELIRFLIAQGLQTLLEQTVVVQCRKEDLSIIQKELPSAIKLFQENMLKSTAVKPTANVTIDNNNFLPAGISNTKDGITCAGGVILSARNGQILCKNTLDHRLELAFNALKPTVRGTLFGVRPKIVSNVVRKKGAVSAPK